MEAHKYEQCTLSFINVLFVVWTNARYICFFFVETAYQFITNKQVYTHMDASILAHTMAAID